MASGESPDAWLGLLKWTLSHQDGTMPSEARPMADEDRAWLEKVLREGVRDDFKAMTSIYSRLCTYLDLASTNPPPPFPRTPVVGPDATGVVSISTGTPTDFVQPAPPAVGSAPAGTGARTQAAAAGPGASTVGTLSTCVVEPPAFSSPPRADLAPAMSAGAAGAGGTDVGRRRSADELNALEEGILQDLDELQEIVEQIDAAATFAKIGGFGRLIALVAPSRRPEKLRLRAASVIATLTKNNPPAQAAFSSSGGQRALIEASAAAGAPPTGTASATSSSSSAASAAPALSLPLQRAILHALSCSVMGLPPAEEALCLDPGFQVLLARALSQERAVDGEHGADDVDALPQQKEQSRKLRSKAAFVLKALISAPEATRERAEALWPAVSGLMTALEALAAPEAGAEDPAAAAARETCIEALLAAARGLDADRLRRDLGSRVYRVIAARRQHLFEARATASPEDLASANFELRLWMEFDALTGPAQ